MNNFDSRTPSTLGTARTSPHQRYSAFMIKFFLLIALFVVTAVITTNAWALSTIRGPYLQSGTPNSIIIRWRTDSSSNSVVRYGTSLGNLNQTASSPTSTRNHEIKLTNLAPETTYYYSVGSTSQVLSGNNADHFFVTSPPNGSPRPTRIWVIGDSGTANGNARSVRDAYLDFAAGSYAADLMLMLGDNAYNDGTDSEYQAAVFNMYPSILRNTVVWSTLGNHDGYTADSASQTGPYYDIFTFPRAGEAGGLASGTEAYYSFDYANIHFICLDSYETNRSPNGPMLTWLEQDLAATTQDWIIAYWHHPPYSKGSHDSDTEGRLIDMRENVLPILEDYGVDLVLSGHSHSYERSYLLDGHYGFSSSLSNSMILDGGDGREDGDGAYVKTASTGRDGAVYIVAGSSGLRSGGPLNHPAMFLSLNNLGSLILDADDNKLDVTFLRENGSSPDYFTIEKGDDLSPPEAVDAVATSPSSVRIQFNEALASTTAENASHYQINGGVSVLSAQLLTDNRSVELTTSTLAEGVTYTVSIANVEDLDGNAVIPGEQISFQWLNRLVLDVQVGQSSDDAEQRIADGSMYLDSSDLELVNDTGYNGLQTVGMRFQNVTVPQGANIIAAYIEFETDETSSGSTSLSIYGQDSSSASTFTNTTNNISSRPKTSAAVSWNPSSWNVVSQKNQTPDLRSIVQEVVNRNDWSSGNNMAFIVTGSGTRSAESYDGEAANAPLLHIEYGLDSGSGDEQAPSTPNGLQATSVGSNSVALSWNAANDNVAVTGYNIYRNGTQIASSSNLSHTDTSVLPNTTYGYQVSAFDAAGNESNRSATLNVTTEGHSTTLMLDVQVGQSSDDAEQRVSNGSMYLDSSDLELVNDTGYNGLQTVGMRFQNVTVPQGSNIIAAYIEFETDETSSGSTSLSIYGQDSSSASTFTSTTNNISSRPKTSAAVSWNPSSWNVVSQKNQTPDLRLIVQEVVNRNDWSSGNNMAFIVTGSGTRSAESYDGEAANAPLLHIEYGLDSGSNDEEPPSTPSGLRTTSVGSNSVALSWNAANDNVAVTGYNIYRNGTQIASSSNLSHTDTSVLPNTTYGYQVSAFDAAGNESNRSATLTVTTDNSPLPLPGRATNPSPANLSTNVTTNSVLTWISGANTDSFRVYFGTDPTPDSGEFRGSQTNTFYSPSPLSENTTYYWRIDAVNTQGVTAGSTWRFTTQNPVITDTVTIRKAEWKKKKKELKVEATSSQQPNAVLTVEGFGQMEFKKDKYKLTVKKVDNPGTVRVISSFGGSATKSVKEKK